MRTLVTAAALGLLLAVAACNQADQQKTKTDAEAAQASAQQAGNDIAASAKAVGEDVKTSAKDVSIDVKKVANDPEVKKAQGELKAALKDFGASVKDAAKKNQHEGGKSTGSNDNG
jgi:gas vesicle protein